MRVGNTSAESEACRQNDERFLKLKLALNFQRSPRRMKFSPLLSAFSFITTSLVAGDWNQWRGPDRNGV
jgi:hypothetical protein